MRRPLTAVPGYLRRVVARRCDGGLSDAELLERFAARRDQAAFEALVWRHGPMVYGVARRVLHHADDAEDVLQATFLVLVRRATAIGHGHALASWLYQVAYRTALRLRSRRAKEVTSAAIADLPAAEPARQPLDPPDALDEELRRLPEKYRTPLVLSYLQGLPNREIAARMACPVGTVFTRLARGRALLRKRLVRRGATLTAGLLATGGSVETASAGPSEELARATVRAAIGGARAPAPDVVALAESVARTVRRNGQLRLLAAALVALVAAGSGTALWASREGPPVLVRAESADPGDARPPKDADRPRVAEVFPADGATDVKPVTEIRIRFDRPMKPTSTYLSWLGAAPIGFRPGGEPRYDAAKREFVLPVQLSPGCKHELMVNQVDDPHPGPGDASRLPDGFRSEAGAKAVPFRWSFTTAKPADKGGPAPRVSSVFPPSDTEVGQLTALEVAFDGPMDPLAYGLTTPDPEGFDRGPELLMQADYHPERDCFTLLMRLPAHWNGEVRLTGFRSREGDAAEPHTLQYRTGRGILAPSLQKQVERVGRSPDLPKIVERIRATRWQLRSVSEEAVTNHCFGITTGDRYQLLQSHASRFQMDGDRKFLGVVDDFLRMPFRIGVNDTTCWLRGGNDLYTQASAAVRDKRLRICDPFDALSGASTADTIRNLKLDYLGDRRVRGRRCHAIRSWDVTTGVTGNLSPVRTWFIDAETLLPLRVEQAGNGLQTTDYAHSHINQLIPDADFQPEAAAGLILHKDDPLSMDCTRRFLTISDGTAGRISVRWGEAGAKVSRSGGLN